MDDFPHLQDTIGQLAILRTYSHLLLGFPVPDNDSRDAIVEDIHDAARKLTFALPWLAGKVVNQDSGPANTGRFKVLRDDSSMQRNTWITVQDQSDEFPPYDELVQRRAPSHLLPGASLAPCIAFPVMYHEPESPVLLIRLNFINGGLLLDCAAQHNFIDMTGIEQCLRLLATAMRGQAFPAFALEQADRDRRNLIPLLGPNEPMLDHASLRRPSMLQPDPPKPPPSQAKWHYFRFTASALASLKALAEQPSTHHVAATVPFVSTNDALVAFCWQRLSNVRLDLGLCDPERPSKFFRAINSRRPLKIPPEYMGHMSFIANSALSLQDIVDAPVSAIATRLRKDVNDAETAYAVRSYVTLIAREPDKSTISLVGAYDREADILSSSWAHVNSAHDEFGRLGQPDFVRRPDFGPIPCEFYLMPKTRQGDIDALVCLEEALIHKLRADTEWSRFTEYIG